MELTIPTSQIGRIIGKGGASVRELQKITAANVKFPEQPSGGQQQPAANLGGDSPVHIIGSFYASQVNNIPYILILLATLLLFETSVLHAFY